jgi:hypothetical protein
MTSQALAKGFRLVQAKAKGFHLSCLMSVTEKGFHLSCLMSFRAKAKGIQLLRFLAKAIQLVGPWAEDLFL